MNAHIQVNLLKKILGKCKILIDSNISLLYKPITAENVVNILISSYRIHVSIF